MDSLDTECLDCVKDCLKDCWQEDPEDRPEIKTIGVQLRPMWKDIKPNLYDNMVRNMEKYDNNLEALVDERTEQLVEEKKKTDALLSEMFPKSVAEQLKNGNQVQAERFKSVTIYFSNIVGFTKISAKSTPSQVVDFLNDLYTCFDSIIEGYNVYNVKTIGHAYMVVSGLNERNDHHHAADIATMSLDILSTVNKIKIKHRPLEELQIRIGIHTGVVYTGVVGQKIPRYCLFGDTVNTAYCMESNGIAQKIHCSEETKVLLEKSGGYELKERELIKLERKGEVRTYFLISEDPDWRKYRERTRRIGRIRSCLKNNLSPASSFETPIRVSFAENHVVKILEEIKDP